MSSKQDDVELYDTVSELVTYCFKHNTYPEALGITDGYLYSLVASRYEQQRKVQIPENMEYDKYGPRKKKSPRFRMHSSSVQQIKKRVGGNNRRVRRGS